jgi:rubrerythrin
MELIEKVTETQTVVKAFTIKCTDDLITAANMVKNINGLIKEVKASFDPIVSKANDAVKEARTQRDKHLSPLESAKEIVNAEINTWNVMQKKLELAQAEEKKAVAQTTGDFLAEIEAEHPADVKPVSNMYFKDNWRAEVVDESLVPRQFLCVDTVKLNQYARMEKEKAVCPGVKFYNQQTPVVR